MTTQILIHAHAGAQEVFNRHLPLWQRHGLPITVMCPEDAPVRTELPVVLNGKAAQLGYVAYLRWRKALDWMGNSQAERWMVFEYDAVCLSAKLPNIGRGVQGVVHGANGDQWLAHRYPGYPMAIGTNSAFAMARVAEEYPEVQELGYCDRLYAALAMLANVPVMPWRPEGVCVNTIRPEDHAFVQGRLEQGAKMIHGIKSREAFDLCEKYLS